MPERIVIRVGAQACPTDNDHLKRLSQQLLHQCAELNRLKLDVETDAVQLVLHQRAQIFACRVARIRLELDFQRRALFRSGAAVALPHTVRVAVSPAGRLQNPRRQLRVEGIWLDGRVVGPPDGGQHIRCDLIALPQVDLADYRLVIQRMCYRLAHGQITQDRMRVLLNQIALLILTGLRVLWIGQVQADVAVAVVLERVQVQTGIKLHGRQLLRLHTDQVQFTGLQLGQPRARVRNDLVDPPVHVGRALPVGVVAQHRRVVVPCPLIEHKRARADGRRLVQRRVHHITEILGIEMARQPAQAEVIQRVTLDLAIGNADRKRIQHLDAFNIVQIRLARRLDQVAGDGVIGELEVVCRHLLAIRPHHTVLQMESPDQPIFGHIPALRHLRGHNRPAERVLP